jgi:hypothetical protein
MADDKIKLEGQRRAVREHIEKYKNYPDPRDKDFAYKTIRNAQEQIQKIRIRHPHWPMSFEDNWRP